MTKLCATSKNLILVVCVFAMSFLVIPYASADIIHVLNNTGCASGLSGICVGGTLTVAGTTPFSLTDLENGTETLLQPGLTPAATVGNSQVPTYVIDNDTGSTTFSLAFNGTLANNAFLTCQVTGGSEGCSIAGSLGTVDTNGQYGPPGGSSNWSPDVTLTFTGIPAGDFDLTFASFAHAGTDTGNITPVVPEPASLLLLSTGMIGALGALRRRVRS